MVGKSNHNFAVQVCDYLTKMHQDSIQPVLGPATLRATHVVQAGKRIQTTLFKLKDVLSTEERDSPQYITDCGEIYMELQDLMGWSLPNLLALICRNSNKVRKEVEAALLQNDGGDINTELLDRYLAIEDRYGTALCEDSEGEATEPEDSDEEGAEKYSRADETGRESEGEERTETDEMDRKSEGEETRITARGSDVEADATDCESEGEETRITARGSDVEADATDRESEGEETGTERESSDEWSDGEEAGAERESSDEWSDVEEGSKKRQHVKRCEAEGSDVEEGSKKRQQRLV